LKERDRQVIWLEYFDANLSRRKGRRVSRSLALSGPRPEAIEDALRRLGLRYEVHQARYPKLHWKPSYYFQVEKRMKKEELIRTIAETIRGIRTSRSATS